MACLPTFRFCLGLPKFACDGTDGSTLSKVSKADPFLLQFGARLRQAREAKNLKQIFVAKSLGADTSTISRWENGQNEPMVKTLLRLADLYAVSVDWLLGRSPQDGLLLAGTIVVDSVAKRRLDSAAAQSGTLDDLADLASPPHLRIAWTVPDQHEVVEPNGARRFVEDIERKIADLRSRTKNPKS